MVCNIPPNKQWAFRVNRVICPLAEVVAIEPSLKDNPILLLSKSHLKGRNNVGLILPLLRAMTKLWKTCFKPWASSSLAGRQRPVYYESGSEQGRQLCLRTGNELENWPLRWAVKEESDPASRKPCVWGWELGDSGTSGADTRAGQSVYSATIERRTVMSSGFPPAGKEE